MAWLRGILLAGALAFGLGSVSTALGQDAAPTTASSAPVASAARLTTVGDRLHLEVDFDHVPVYASHYVDTPPRLLLDFPGAVLQMPENAIATGGLVKAIRYGAMAEGQARMVITLAHPVRVTRSEVAAGSGGNGSAMLVIEGERTSAEEYRQLVAGQTWERALTPSTTAPVSTEPSKPAATAADPLAGPFGMSDGAAGGPFLVAVDAGHGGIDTGASGTDGKTMEKDVTLAFARTLVDHLNKEPGIKAFMVREKDEFLSLTARVDIARSRKANLFISFHADTLNQGDIRGATVYTISDTASDKLAASIAARENFSDELAGVQLEAEEGEVSDILLDLTRRETQAFSVTFAQSVIQSFKGQIGLINNPHRSAGFRVLRAPDIPSILLELGFLSNPKDEAQLLDPAWREKIGALLTAAVRQYRASGGDNPTVGGD